MKNLILALVLMGFAATAKTAIYELPVQAVKAKLDNQDQTTPALMYAVDTPLKDLSVLKGVEQNGEWTKTRDRIQWSVQISSAMATSLDFGFEELYLPPTAILSVSNLDGTVVHGPFDSAINRPHGLFWPGTIPGGDAIITVEIEPRYQKYLNFRLANVPQGFVKFWESKPQNKSLSCNVDVACPAGDAWADQIDAVARFTIAIPDGVLSCTGQLINNTANDSKPYFLTANHCGFENLVTTDQKQAAAASMNFWWNYESQTCRDPGSAVSGTEISLDGFNDIQTGASFVANNAASDFALVLLDEIPDPAFEVYYQGWDRRNIRPSSAFAIHHPQGHAKRISLENDSPIFISPNPTQFGLDTHLLVSEWETGLTEIGSSGGGLLNQNGLLVGQLQFGDTINDCGMTINDGFGRFYTSWNHSDQTDAHLRTWLDPGQTTQETLIGARGCEVPEVDIINLSSNRIGDVLRFDSQVSGGVGPYTYDWDVNGDAQFDGTGVFIDATYASAYVGNINLTVTDSVGCRITKTQAVVVESPSVQITNAETVDVIQICGNNNNVMDPGERWRANLTAANTGAVTANQGILALSVNRASGLEDSQSDDYGNQSIACERSFIDITQTGDVLPWVGAGVADYPADDEGAVVIQLSQGFDFYGETLNSLAASTNGYFNTNTNSRGDAWDNDCPLPANLERDNVGGRIAAMHDDLRSSVFYHQSFSNCPRPAETGVSLACEVFLWQGADLWSTSEVESMNVQAILYPATSQWVFQYEGEGVNGASTTIGMQNPAASDGLTHACNSSGSINTTEAVCVFNKNHVPANNAAEVIQVETPAIELGDLAVNATRSAQLDFAILSDAACGTQFGISHDASLFNGGFNAGQNVFLNGTVGGGGPCSPVSFCDVDTSGHDITPRPGLWWNAGRNGNGFDLYTLNASTLVYLFYTGETNGEPVWYLASDTDSAFNQFHNNVTRYQVPGGFDNGTLGFRSVGWSSTTFLDDSNAIQVRMINGTLSAEKLEFFQYGADATPNVHTGLYYTPSENGWGQSVGTLGNSRVVINYLYTNAGEPYWTIASGPNDGSSLDANYFNTFCPHCPAVTLTNEVVGEVQMQLNGQAGGTLNLFRVDSPAGKPAVNWFRSNLPVTNLVPPSGN